MIQICEYGCCSPAIHQFKNGRWCCSERTGDCPSIKKSKSSAMKKRWSDPNSTLNSTEHRKKLSDGVKTSWDNDPERKIELSKWNNKKWNDKTSFFNSNERQRKIGKVTQRHWDDKNSKFNSKEHLKKLKISCKISIDTIENKYPTFYKIEELRYDPNYPNDKIIQGHCKNHNCVNSKEMGGWFSIGKYQLSDRIRQIEAEDGVGGCYFYCSQYCKDACKLYKKRVSQLIREDQINAGLIEKPLYTYEEYQTLRQEVLRRDDNKCLYCGEKAEYVHHTRPVKLEPFFALDPDLSISCCKKCHYKYGHKDECSTGQLANKICGELI